MKICPNCNQPGDHTNPKQLGVYICEAFSHITQGTGEPALTTPKFHNPDNLPTAGDPPWRFLVKGELPQHGDEWCRKYEQRMIAWRGMPPMLNFYPENTYRTRRHLPAPQPGGGGEGDKAIPAPIYYQEKMERLAARPVVPYEVAKAQTDTILKGGDATCATSTPTLPKSSIQQSEKNTSVAVASNAEESTSNPSLHPPTAPIALPVRVEGIQILGKGYWPWNEQTQQWDYSMCGEVATETDRTLVDGWEWKEVAIVPLDALNSPRSETEGRDKERWQPIATAEKEHGKAVLVFCSERRNTYTVCWSNYPDSGHWRHFGGYSGDTLTEEPTHWQPLPPPPALAHEQEAGKE